MLRIAFTMFIGWGAYAAVTWLIIYGELLAARIAVNQIANSNMAIATARWFNAHALAAMIIVFAAILMYWIWRPYLKQGQNPKETSE